MRRLMIDFSLSWDHSARKHRYGVEFAEQIGWSVAAVVDLVASTRLAPCQSSSSVAARTLMGQRVTEPRAHSPCTRPGAWRHEELGDSR
ncbi:MAG: hypothetical protein QOJ06_491 [Pseudonocardiales bacterium]|jgi:hypothetical protein|nr:hypothetical protein [Pseudonocardiales bacterium]